MADPDPPPFDLHRAHRWFAVEANNLAWDLVEKADRTAGDTGRMVHAAHAACFHWLAVGTPVNHLRALTLLTVACREAGQHGDAIAYGRQGVAMLDGVADATAFDRASVFAATAAAVTADSGRRSSEGGAMLRQARTEAERITDDNDRSAFARFYPGVFPKDPAPTPGDATSKK